MLPSSAGAGGVGEEPPLSSAATGTDPPSSLPPPAPLPELLPLLAAGGLPLPAGGGGEPFPPELDAQPRLETSRPVTTMARAVKSALPCEELFIVTPGWLRRRVETRGPRGAHRSALQRACPEHESARDGRVRCPWFSGRGIRRKAQDSTVGVSLRSAVVVRWITPGASRPATSALTVRRRRSPRPRPSPTSARRIHFFVFHVMSTNGFGSGGQLETGFVPSPKAMIQQSSSVEQ